MKKKYLVTYSKPKVDEHEAGETLSKTRESNAIHFEAPRPEGSSDEEEDSIHFKELGMSLVNLTETEAAELSELEDVMAIEEDYSIGLPEPIEMPEEDKDIPEAAAARAHLTDTTLSGFRRNLELIHAPEAWSRGITGAGVNVAILDTGIADHPNLVISGGVSFIPGVTSHNDGNGHGTLCAGIVGARFGYNNVWGVAKDCNLYAVKVLNDQGGGGYISTVIRGLNWCIANNIQVASLSLGDTIKPSYAYAEAIARCKQHGVSVVCASGNDVPQGKFSWVRAPANSTLMGGNPYAVGAISDDQTIAWFSCRGTDGSYWNPVTVVAPGVQIYTTSLNGGYKTDSGTSLACPHVSGLVALMHQKFPTLSPDELMKNACLSATRQGIRRYPDEAYGYGLVNCDKATL